MSTFKRLAGGQMATMVSLGAGLLCQILSVPVYVSHWSATAFGAWLGVQAAVSLLSCPDWGMLDYAAFRVLQLGPSRTRSVSRLLGACMLVGATFGLVEFLVAVGIVVTSFHLTIFGLSSHEAKDVVYGSGIAFLTSTLSSSVFMSVASYLNRIAPAFGLYSRLMWWTAAVAVVTVMVPTYAVSRGATMATAAYCQLLGVTIITSAQSFDLYQRLAALGIKPSTPHKALPFLLFRRARLGYAKNILEQTRQQGVRVILALLTGAADVAVFSTTRTISNVMLQVGLTLSNPIIPELASLVRERKAIHIAGAFTLIWIVMAVVITPGALIINIVGSPLFHWWTHGKLHFDDWLLASLTAGVVCSFGAFPAMQLVRSQNDFVSLTRVMLGSSVALIGTMIAIVPKLGATGAGIGLLVGEATVYVMITIDARKWMSRLDLSWPTKSLRLSQVALAIGGGSMAMIARYPSAKWFALVACCGLELLVAYLLFLDLPSSLRSRISGRFLGRRS